MYRDRWSKPALRTLGQLSSDQRERIKEAVADLCKDPMGCANVLPLKGQLKGKFRKRVGDLRIIFSLSKATGSLPTEAGCVDVLTVDWRGNVY